MISTASSSHVTSVTPSIFNNFSFISRALEIEYKTDRRVRNTKKALRDGLTDLMLHKSIKDISVKELTDKVDLNRGTYYLHYKDIFDMVEKIEEEMFKDFTIIMNFHSTYDPNCSPYNLLEDIFIFLKENSTMCTVLLSSNGDIAFVNKLQELVRESCLNIWCEIFPKSQDDFEYFYTFLISGCMGLFETWLKTGLKESPKEMATISTKIILNGVGIFNK